MSQTIANIQAWVARDKAERMAGDRLAPARGVVVGVMLGLSAYAVVAVGIWFVAFNS